MIVQIFANTLSPLTKTNKQSVRAVLIRAAAIVIQNKSCEQKVDKDWIKNESLVFTSRTCITITIFKVDWEIRTRMD